MAATFEERSTETADGTGTVSQITGAEIRHRLLAGEQITKVRLSPSGSLVAFADSRGDGPQRLTVVNTDTDSSTSCPLPAEHLIVDLDWGTDERYLLYTFSPRGRGFKVLGRATVEGPWPDGEVKLEPVPPFVVRDHWPGPAGFAVHGLDPETKSNVYRVFDHSGRPISSTSLDGQPFSSLLVDRQLQLRGGIAAGTEGGLELWVGSDLDTARTLTMSAGPVGSDVTVVGFDRSGVTLYVLATTGATAGRALFAADTETGEVRLLMAHETHDLDWYPIVHRPISLDPHTFEPEICSIIDQRPLYLPLVSTIDRRLEAMTESGKGVPVVLLDRSRDDGRWLVVDVTTDGPIGYRIFQPETGADKPLFVNRPDLEHIPLTGLRDFVVTARDGVVIPGYAMSPPVNGPADRLAVIVHGGPHARDYWRFHSDAHYLASLSHASIHLNFRGSVGFGAEFRRRGRGEWGGAMQTDLYDGVAAAVAEEIVTPDARIVFFGSSYGGYASLMAALTRPDLVDRAVAISPPVDLLAMALDPPRYWQPISEELREQIVGANGADPDLIWLQQRSPWHALSARSAPLFIAHGARDPRIPVDKIEEFVDRARSLGVEVELMRFDDEGHQISAPRNRRTLFAAIDAFLEVQP